MPRSSVKELIQGDGRLLRRTTTRELVYKNIKRFENPDKGESSSGRKPVGNKTFIIGSEGTVYHDNHDKGFFSTVLNAYAHHWTLVTKPDDWWFTILRRIAIAIDENSTKENVRNFFVDHEGRKRLEVKVKPPLDTEDFQWFFDQMADQVEKNIKRPEYVRLARPEFSTTTPDISMVANIAVMSSLQVQGPPPPSPGVLRVRALHRVRHPQGGHEGLRAGLGQPRVEVPEHEDRAEVHR